MRALAAHERAAIDELIEWWEDLHDRSTGTQLVSVVAPRGWGRTTVLDVLADRIGTDQRLGKVLRLAGRDAPDGLGLQVAWLRDVIKEHGCLPQVREALGVHRLEGVAERGLGAVGLLGLVTGLPGLMAGLPASLLLSVMASARDRTEAGQLAVVGRLAGAIASYSRSLPVALIVDDAELLDPRLVERVAFAILDRLHSNVLVVVATTPAAPVLARFNPTERYGPRWGRIGAIDVDVAMDESARRRLIEAATSGWPPAAVDRLVGRSRSFKDIWAVLGLPAAADVPSAGGDDEQRRLVDDLIGYAVEPGVPPPAARVVAWAGGLMHSMQLTAAVAALSGGRVSTEDTTGEPWLSHFGNAVRFANPAYRERADRSASVLSESDRSVIVSAIRQTARAVCDVRGSGVSAIDVVSLLRPVLHLSQHGAMAVDADAAELLAQLPDELEAFGDTADALRVATVILDLLDPDDLSTTAVVDRLTATVLRLGNACGDEAAAERARDLAESMEAGAIIGLEAAVWTAITLLDRPDTRPAGSRIVDAVEEKLRTQQERLGVVSVEWRLLLAFHAGRGGYLTLAEKLLAPLLDGSGPQADRSKDLAFQLLAAVSSAAGAGLRLHRQALLDEYQKLDENSEPDLRLAIVETLASIANRLGDYAQALKFGHVELATRLTLFPADHPATLAARHNVAFWTGQVGDARKALALLDALVPDQTRVLGPDHPDTLSSRHNVASLTGEMGDARRALALFKALLLDQTRVLGPDHPATLTTRHNVASWTGEVGDARKALALCEALVPDRTRVLGPDHPDTLTTRSSLAFWTGEAGDARKALALCEALVPDRIRVLGPDHPATLTTRHNVASWTGLAGDARKALALCEALLPDRTRVLGPDHPETLITRSSLAFWTGEAGDARKALALCETLVPDETRVLGPAHPTTLTTRHNVASWTALAGDARKALAMLEALLPDRTRVLGPDHPETLATRSNVASWTGEAGDARKALALFIGLLPDQTRVMGPHHPAILTTRSNVASWTGQGGDARKALALFIGLLPDQTRVLGPDHPDTLTTRSSVAFWTRKAGDAQKALAMLEALLPDQTRVLGSDHPATQTTRAAIESLRTG